MDVSTELLSRSKSIHLTGNVCQFYCKCMNNKSRTPSAINTDLQNNDKNNFSTSHLQCSHVASHLYFFSKLTNCACRSMIHVCFMAAGKFADPKQLGRRFAQLVFTNICRKRCWARGCSLRSILDNRGPHVLAEQKQQYSG